MVNDRRRTLILAVIAAILWLAYFVDTFTH